MTARKYFVIIVRGSVHENLIGFHTIFFMVMRFRLSEAHHYISKTKPEFMKQHRMSYGKRLAWMLLIIPAASIVNCSDQGIATPDYSVQALTAGCTFTKAQAESIQFFPSTYALNQAIDTAPLDSRSAAIMSFILTTTGSTHLQNDFAAAKYQGAPVG